MGFDYRNYQYEIENIIDNEKENITTSVTDAVENALYDFPSYRVYDDIEDIIESAYNDGYEEAEEECRTLFYDEAYEKGVNDTIKAVYEGLSTFVYEKLGIKKPETPINPEVVIEETIAENEEKLL